MAPAWLRGQRRVLLLIRWECTCVCRRRLASRRRGGIESAHAGVQAATAGAAAASPAGKGVASRSRNYAGRGWGA